MSGAGRWMAAAVGLALVAGGSLGVVADRMVLREPAEGPSGSRSRSGSIWFDCEAEVEVDSGRAARWRERKVEALRVELDLDRGQVERMSDALGRHGELAREFWRETRTGYCDLRDSLRDEVRQMLHDEQLERFERRLQRIDERDRQRIHGDLERRPSDSEGGGDSGPVAPRAEPAGDPR